MGQSVNALKSWYSLGRKTTGKCMQCVESLGEGLGLMPLSRELCTLMKRYCGDIREIPLEEFRGGNPGQEMVQQG